MPAVNDGRVPILYIAPWVDLGGSDKGTIDWFKHIDRERWAPSLITTQPSANRWLHHVDPWAEEIWELPDVMPGPSFPGFIMGFIESRGVEVVHIMNSRLAFDLMPDMTCLRKPPAVVVQMHAEEPDRSGYVRYVATRYGNLVDAFSATSEQLKAAIVDYDIPPSRVEVIYTGVDGEEEFNPARVQPLPHPSDDGTPRILWPGRLAEQKDPMLTLDVLSAVRDRGVPFLLEIVGDGHMAPAVRRRADELGLSDSIVWHPPSQNMAQWYRSTDLLLMTSVFEGVPYVIYEALAMGVPVVAPALTGNVELMDSDSGILVEPRDDVAQYADAIAALLQDEDRRRRMGERSRKRMLADFSLGEMGRRHDELYARLLDARPATTTRRSEDLPEPDEVRFGHGSATVPESPLRLSRDPLPERTVGVIVPCYRHGIFLEECVRSIKSQTLPPCGIVIVDDGSDDPETVEALARVAEDPDVTVVRQQINSGPSAARNRALSVLEANYVLPLDADDQLMPDALERMLTQLEAAPPDVGFIYPHAQHFGNRSDYVQSPAYNLWLLTQNNYCPAPSLFDRRVFEAGVAYAEDIVFGHEDWDLVLQLAERGIHGQHADGPTFRYRRQGFSRVNAVEYGPHAFHEAIERRHPPLYRDRDRIKAEWAPALSILLLDGDEGMWKKSDLAGLSAQTCRDFEVLTAVPRTDDARVIDCDDDSPAAWLQAAVAAARGRWISVLTPATASTLRRPSLVEHLVRGLWISDNIAALVLGVAPDVTRHAFSQLTDAERLEAQPVGVTFERTADTAPLDIELGLADSLVADIVLALQMTGPTQWRLAPDARTNGGEPASGRRRANNASVRLDLRREPARDRGEALMRRALKWEPPRLPELTPGTVRRWAGAAAWIPPEAHPLCRHRAIDEERWVVTTERQPPVDHVLEFDLGVVHRFALPGTKRLVEHDGTFSLTEDQNEFDDDRRGLGYVEQAPLPMLDVLEVRRMPSTGQHVLVAGPDDPLGEVAEPVATLGWIEPFPIRPHKATTHKGPWGVVPLRRYTDRSNWRHRYRSGGGAEEPDSVGLGSLLPEPSEALTPLRLRSDGRLETDLVAPSTPSTDPRTAARWVAAPLTWSGGRPPSWAGRATASRARRLIYSRTQGQAAEGATVLGWLRRFPATGFSPLFSATHPVTGDQFVTRSEIEACDLGYRIDGTLGFILDVGADRAMADQPKEILWGSRFGRQRRYLEGRKPW